jgi:hypothetical protein
MQLTLTISDDLKNDYLEAGAALVAFNNEVESATKLASKYLNVSSISLNDETKKKKNELEEREGDLYSQISKALMTSAIEQMTVAEPVEAKPVPKKEKAKKVKIEAEPSKVEAETATEVKPLEEQVISELPPYLQPIYKNEATKLQYECITVLDGRTKDRIVSNFYELDTHEFVVANSDKNDESMAVLRLKDLISFHWDNAPTEKVVDGYINILKIIFQVSKKLVVQKLASALIGQFMRTKAKFCQETNSNLKTAGEAIASFLRAVDEANQRVSIKNNATSDDLLEELLKNVKDTKLPTEVKAS